MLLAKVLGRNKFKGVLIPQHGEHNVAELVYHGSKDGHFCFDPALFLVAGADDRVLRFAIFQAYGLYGQDIEAAPHVRQTTFSGR